MYGCASLLHWVYVLKRVRMRAYFLDSSWCIFWVRVWVIHSIFVREMSDLSLMFLDPCHIHHYIHFFMWLIFMLWYGLTITHFSISLSSFIFILFLNFTCSHLISLFSHPAWCLIWVHHPHFILAYLICPFLYHHFFVWGCLGPLLMMFSTHCISCIRGMGIISLGLLSLVSFRFFSFLSPYCLNLRYVPCLKTTLRPWLHIMLDNSRMGNAWDWLEIISWSMMNEEL